MYLPYGMSSSAWTGVLKVERIRPTTPSLPEVLAP